MILSIDLLRSNGFTLMPNSHLCYQKEGISVCFYSWDHMVASIGMDHYKRGDNLTIEDLSLFYTDKTGKDLELSY